MIWTTDEARKRNKKKKLIASAISSITVIALVVSLIFIPDFTPSSSGAPLYAEWTTQTDFTNNASTTSEATSTSQISTTSSPGDVILGSATSSFSETFADQTNMDPGSTASWSGGEAGLTSALSWATSYDSPAAFIFSSQEYNGKLYAGAGYPGKIYQYDGNSWSESYDGSDADIIYNFIVFEGNLYAGGELNGSSRIFKFDGSSWTSAQSGSSSNSPVKGLAIYNDELVRGVGKNVQKYNGGTSWSTIVSNVDDGPIHSLAVYNGDLYIGTWDGSDGYDSTWDGTVWKYDGSTKTLIYDSGLGSRPDWVSALAVYNSKLYFGISVKSSPYESKIVEYDGVSTTDSYSGLGGAASLRDLSLITFNNK